MKKLDHTCRFEEEYTIDGKVEYGNECLHDWFKYCDGNPHKCRSAYRKYIASLSDRKRELFVKKHKDFFFPDEKFKGHIR